MRYIIVNNIILLIILLTTISICFIYDNIKGTIKKFCDESQEGNK